MIKRNKCLQIKVSIVLTASNVVKLARWPHFAVGNIVTTNMASKTFSPSCVVTIKINSAKGASALQLYGSRDVIELFINANDQALGESGNFFTVV